MFTNNPKTPTTTISLGLWIVSTSINLINTNKIQIVNKLFYYTQQIETHLLHASTVIEKHKATKNTAFTNAPSTSALAHPKVFFDHFFGDICKY